MPYELAKTNGGFMSRETVNHFVKFAEVCFKRYKSKVKYWMTFNEINNQMNYANDIFGWTNSGVHFGDYKNPEEAMYICAHHTLVASALAVKIWQGNQSRFSNRKYDCYGTDLSLFFTSRRCTSSTSSDA